MALRPPSGTEPKIKFYYEVNGTSMEDADARSEKMGSRADQGSL